MLSTIKLQLSSPLFANNSYQVTAGKLVPHWRFSIRLRRSQLASISVHSENVSSSEPLITSIGSSSAPPQLSQWNLTQRHVNILSFIACTSWCAGLLSCTSTN
ncbi:putative systemin-like isoform X1 [Capsicum annuum]|nr:putative systemin-like isoform X1 [Capsicum annuum]